MTKGLLCIAVFVFLLGVGVSPFYVYSLLGAFLAPFSIHLSLLIKKIIIYQPYSIIYQPYS